MLNEVTEIKQLELGDSVLAAKLTDGFVDGIFLSEKAYLETNPMLFIAFKSVWSSRPSQTDYRLTLIIIHACYYSAWLVVPPVLIPPSAVHCSIRINSFATLGRRSSINRYAITFKFKSDRPFPLSPWFPPHRSITSYPGSESLLCSTSCKPHSFNGSMTPPRPSNLLSSAISWVSLKAWSYIHGWARCRLGRFLLSPRSCTNETINSMYEFIDLLNLCHQLVRDSTASPSFV